jgi:hypothetical protein
VPSPGPSRPRRRAPAVPTPPTPALLAWSNAPDLLAASGPDRSVFGNIPQSALARLPQTTDDAPVAEYSVVQPSDIALLAPESQAIPGAFWRRKILAGRLPDPRRAGEVNISFTLAQARHLRVGGVLRVNVLTPGARPRPVAATATSGIGHVSALLGIRLAVQPGAGKTAVPVRSTIASAVVGVAALTAAIVFSASLGHLLASPRQYGVTWDADVQNVNNTGIAPVIGAVARDPQVTAWATAYAGAPLEVDRVRADAIAISPGHGGSFLPTPTVGRLPRAQDEIALGARTLRTIGSHVGGTVTVSLAGFRPARLKVVGTAVFPTLSDRLGLGSGSTMTVDGLRHLLPRSVPFPPFDTLLVRFRPRAGVQAGADALAGRVSRNGPFSVSGPATPTDLVNFGRVQDLPFLLGMALGLLALVTIVHLLLTAVRRRRRDFAILRVIGLTRGQVRATVGWQAATLACAALAIGVPAGVLLGRAAWRVFAGQLGILPVVAVPWQALTAMAAIALAVAVAAAALPGESAARSAPATILRSG